MQGWLKSPQVPGHTTLTTTEVMRAGPLTEITLTSTDSTQREEIRHGKCSRKLSITWKKPTGLTNISSSFAKTEQERLQAQKTLHFKAKWAC